MEEKYARELLVECGNEMLDKGLVARTWGNISCRADKTHMLITPSGLDYRSMGPEDIVLVDINTLEWKGIHKPSSEKGVHAAAYRIDPDTEFVIHTHQEYATALGLAGADSMDISDTEKIELGKTAVASYGLSGTKKLTTNVTKQYETGAKTVFLVHHGVVIAGAAKDETIRRALLLDSICRRNCRVDITAAPVADRDRAQKIINAVKSRFPCSAAVLTPAAVLAALEKKPVYAQVDDMAQMIGKLIPVSVSDKAEDIISVLEKNDAVLVPGIGAVVKSDSEDDCEALQILTEKAALCHLHTAAMNREKECRLGTVDVALQHLVYTKKYARQK